MERIYKLLFLVMILMFCSAMSYGQITYVNHAATGANNGTSWANAYTSLRSAIIATSNGEIWVAQGTYYPATVANPNRSLSFTLKNNVAIYGGFTGTETARSQRDYENNETIMSGDIGVANDTSDNSYHVIYVDGSITTVDSTSILDGFIIRYGNANGLIYPTNSGGGFLGENNVNPIITNCKFKNNYAGIGGAFADSESRTSFINVTFENNFANSFGGAGSIANSTGTTLDNCSFINNSIYEHSGGALIVYRNNEDIIDTDSIGNVVFGNYNAAANVTINNCLFEENKSYGYLGGGAITFLTSKATVTNCKFIDNEHLKTSTMYSGGAILNFGHTTIINCFLTGNESKTTGGAIENYELLFIYNSTISFNYVRKSNPTTNNIAGVHHADGTLVMKNTILSYNFTTNGFFPIFNSDYLSNSGAVATITHCIGQNLPASSNNSSADPKLISPSNYLLQSTSPAINAGDNSAVPAGITTDIEGNDRISGGTVDIGAYEFNTCSSVYNNRIYVDANRTSGLNDGLTWNNAFQDLQDALAFAQSCEAVEEIWVADGTYYPTSGTDRTIAFELKNNLKIYGGFAGNEVVLSQRDFHTNISILSGEIGSTGSTSDNSYHVVTSIGNDNTAILDGFTITKGAANLNSNDNNYGAGLYSDGTSAIIQNCTFTGNAATLGAGVYQKNTGNSTFTNCIFHTNTTVGIGGGGGGAYIREATPTFTNCLFYENNAYFGGGIANFNTQITVTNATFADNSAVFGNGIYSYDTVSQRYTVANCIFWNTSASTPLNRTNFNVTYSIVQGGYTGTGNLNQNPLFVDAANDNYALQGTSPAIDAGDNTAIPSGITTDLAGFDRIINGTVNMGAFETSNSVLPVELLYFKGEVVENGNLLTWETATEINNKGFEIQRSTDGRNWFKIGFVQGNGTTLENHVYTFTDELNLTGFQNLSGLYYYRLKQVDFDDNFEYSNVIILTSQFIGNQEITLFPNPVQNDLTIANLSQGNILIYNSLGQIVRQFSVANPQMMIDVSDLESGIYTLKLQTTDGQIAIKQFVKI